MDRLKSVLRHTENELPEPSEHMEPLEIRNSVTLLRRDVFGSEKGSVIWGAFKLLSSDNKHEVSLFWDPHQAPGRLDYIVPAEQNLPTITTAWKPSSNWTSQMGSARLFSREFKFIQEFIHASRRTKTLIPKQNQVKIQKLLYSFAFTSCFEFKTKPIKTKQTPKRHHEAY